MKEKVKYTITIVISIAIGVIGTLLTLNYCGLFDTKVLEKTIRTVSLSEKDTLKESIDKVYDSVVYIESLKNGNTIGSGSGFVYKKDDNSGYILTNYHVIDGCDEVYITNIKGETVEAKILGADEYTDIAVLKIDEEDVLQVAEFGSSEETNLGDTVFTVGSPLGKDYMGSVTKGIISGKDRVVTVSSSTNNQYVMEVLQVDAALNPEGMGFAIPIELVKSISEKLEKGEKIERPLLGVSMLDIDNQYLLYKNGITIDSSIENGVVVVEVVKNSPAGKASLKKGDVLLAINDDEVTNIAYFRAILYKYSVGDTITIKYLRDNKVREVKVKLDVTLENS